jgi:hypothetical protein
MYRFGAALPPGDTLPPTARLGVIWTDLLERRPDTAMPRDWLSSTIASDSPQAFVTSLYRPPPPGALFQLDTSDGDSIEMAFGEIFIFDDAQPDTYLAGSAEAIIYVARPFAYARDGFPLGPTFSLGYTTLFFDCHGYQVPQDIRQNAAVQFVLQPSSSLPEIRTCMRTHSP